MEYLFKVSAVIAIFYMCYKLFLEKETFFQSNRRFFLVGLILSFCMPLLVITAYIEYTPNSLQDLSAYTFTADSANTLNPDHINVKLILSWFYTIGVVFFLGKLCIELTSLNTLLKNHKVNKTEGYKFIETKEDIPPFSFFNWIVYNPQKFSQVELNHIIAHEKVHAKQLHSLDIILTQLTCIILWFNPFIWLYKKNLMQNLEFIADEKAQNHSKCNKSYQLILLKSSIPQHTFILANNFYNSQIKKRIIMLQQSKSHKLNHYKFLLILPLLALFLMNFNTREVLLKSNSENLNNNSQTGNTKDKTSETVMALITKNSRDTELEAIKAKLEKEGLTVKFKGIKRNNSDEITAIKIDAKSKKSSTNYQVSSDDEAIKPIKIVFNTEENSISIGNGKAMGEENTFVFETKNGEHKIHKSGNGSHVFVIDEEHEHDEDIERDSDQDHDVKYIIKRDGKKGRLKKIEESKNVHVISGDNDDEVIEIIVEEDDNDENHKVIVKSQDKNVWVNKDDSTTEDIIILNKTDDKKKVFISNDEGKKPLYIIDGKESTQKDMDKISPDDIESVSVLKGKSAKEKYGDKGKDGVIIIKTKKED